MVRACFGFGPDDDYSKCNSELVGNGEGGPPILSFSLVFLHRVTPLQPLEMCSKRAMLYSSSLIILADRCRLLDFAATSHRQSEWPSNHDEVDLH
jgi:hypothetical protein